MYKNISNILQQQPQIVNALGERLHEKITEVVIPEWQAAFSQQRSNFRN